MDCFLPTRRDGAPKAQATAGCACMPPADVKRASPRGPGERRARTSELGKSWPSFVPERHAGSFPMVQLFLAWGPEAGAAAATGGGPAGGFRVAGRPRVPSLGHLKPQRCCPLPLLSPTPTAASGGYLGPGPMRPAAATLPRDKLLSAGLSPRLLLLHASTPMGLDVGHGGLMPSRGCAGRL